MPLETEPRADDSAAATVAAIEEALERSAFICLSKEETQAVLRVHAGLPLLDGDSAQILALVKEAQRARLADVYLR